MKEGFSELISYLDKRFNNVETVLEKKADKEDVRRLTSAVDSLAKHIETYFQEFLALSTKVDRLERWIKEASSKIGIRFE